VKDRQQERGDRERKKRWKGRRVSEKEKHTHTYTQEKGARTHKSDDSNTSAKSET